MARKTKTEYLPPGIYAVLKYNGIVGFVRGTDAMDAHQRAATIFGNGAFYGVTTAITVSETEEERI
jgi:hypothetical protein